MRTLFPVLLLALAFPIHASNVILISNTNGEKAIALSSGDFNEDGITDLAVQCNGNKIKIHSGNADSIYKNSHLKPFLKPRDAVSFDPADFHDTEIYMRLNSDAIPDRVFLSEDGSLNAEISAPNSIFTVTQSSDESDADTADGVCDVDLGTGGDQCTLRAAIEQANASAGTDSIEFNIPGGGIPTIGPASAYPDITDPVTIDGSTQSQNMVEIDGTNSAFAIGFQINAGNSVVRGLVINRFSDAIRINGNGNNIIEGNFIGTDTTGMVALPNEGGGVVIVDSINNLVGGTASAAKNLISGNTGVVAGISIQGMLSSGNSVQGNLIGTDISGLNPLGNNEGVFISGPNNIIGGTATGARNILCDHTTAIRVSGPDASGNLIQGNFIGTDITGSNQLGNGTGIALLNASNNTIGGATADTRNIISGNGTGIAVSGGSGNTLQNNFIGTDVSGTAALPNSIAGLIIASSSNNVVGGTATEGNVISGSVFVGILLTGNSATGNQITNNFIGTQADGIAPLGNGLHGVIISNPTGTFPVGNVIQTNVIANNGGDGVYVQGGNANSVLSNSISNNAGLGIDIGTDGVTPNDSGDTDTGANNLQNFPLLTQAVSSGGNTTVTGSLNSLPNTSFTLDFFHSVSCDASANGEGEIFLGSTNVTTDGSGNASVNATFPILVANGRSISATSTDPNGNTSEFSNCVSVGGGSLFSDDFSDGNASDWTFTKGTWTVTNETLTGTVDKKGDAVSPDFGSCSICTFQANLGIQTPGGRVSLIGWYFDKRNLVEVRLMEDKDKVLLIQKSGGIKAAKASAAMTIDPGIAYNLQVSYNGTNFQVFLNGAMILDEPAGAIPSGNAAFRVKSTTGTATTGFLMDISVQ